MAATLPICGSGRDRPRHRDRSHLPARPQVRGGAGPHRAGRARQARGHDGLVRHRCHPCARRHRRAGLRRHRPGVATRDRAGGCAHRGGRQVDGPQFPAGEQLAADLEAAGFRVLLDDRFGPSPGVKFKDAELIGIPTIAVVGRGVADGVIEVKDRRPASDRRRPRRHRRPPPRPRLTRLRSLPAAAIEDCSSLGGGESSIDDAIRSAEADQALVDDVRSPTVVVNTASPSPVRHILTVSASPGRTGEEKRPSMWWNRVTSLPHSACSSARPVKP